VTLLALQRKPPSRRKQARSAANGPRRLLEPPPPAGARTLLAAKVKFGPYSKHKRNPHLYDLERYEGEDEDPTFCDEHAGFAPADIPRAVPLLKRGIVAAFSARAPRKAIRACCGRSTTMAGFTRHRSPIQATACITPIPCFRMKPSPARC